MPLRLCVVSSYFNHSLKNRIRRMQKSHIWKSCSQSALSNRGRLGYVSACLALVALWARKEKRAGGRRKNFQHAGGRGSRTMTFHRRKTITIFLKNTSQPKHHYFSKGKIFVILCRLKDIFKRVTDKRGYFFLLLLYLSEARARSNSCV